jgi:hypothetical protein
MEVSKQVRESDLEGRARSMLEGRIDVLLELDTLDTKVTELAGKLAETARAREECYARATKRGWSETDLRALGIRQEVDLSAPAPSRGRRAGRARRSPAQPSGEPTTSASSPGSTAHSSAGHALSPSPSASEETPAVAGRTW